MDVLQEEPRTQERLAKRLKKAVSTVSYHLSKLERAGLVHKEDIGGVNIYHIRKEFEKPLRRSDADPKVGARHVHSIILSFEIIRDVRRTPEGWKLEKPREKFNWESYSQRFETELGTVYVEKFPSCFLVHLPRLITNDSGEADKAIMALGWAAHQWVCDQFPGIRLGVLDENGQFRIAWRRTRTHYGLPNDPLAQLCYRKNLSFKSDRLEIDNSPRRVADLRKIFPQCQGEIEAISNRRSRELGQNDLEIIWDAYHDILDGSLSKERLDTHESRLGKLLKAGEQQAAGADRLEAAMEKMVQQMGVMTQAMTVAQQQISALAQAIAAERRLSLNGGGLQDGVGTTLEGGSRKPGQGRPEYMG